MTDRRISGERFHKVQGTFVRPACERLLNAAMLIAKRNFQMLYYFPVALKAKMPRFDNAGMYRPDGNFMNLGPSR